MKLYTEEQVKQMFLNKHNDWTGKKDEFFIAEQTPIELPSDEEVEEASDNAWSDYEYEQGNLYSTTFKGGWNLAIKWVIDKIKNKK